MRWDDKVKEWNENEVTNAFFSEIAQDLDQLTEALIKESDTDELIRLQGMVRALRGVLDMPVDGLLDPKLLREEQNDG